MSLSISSNGRQTSIPSTIGRLLDILRISLGELNANIIVVIKVRIILNAYFFQLLRELGPGGLKAAMDMMGYYGGHCRKPLLPINDQTKIRIRKILQKSGFLKWFSHATTHVWRARYTSIYMHNYLPTYNLYVIKYLIARRAIFRWETKNKSNT